MYIDNVGGRGQIERQTGSCGSEKRGLDWHLAGLSLVITALLSWAADADASPGSMLASQGTVARAKVGPVATDLVDTGRVKVVAPSAPKSRKEALVPQQTLHLNEFAALSASAGTAFAAAEDRTTEG